QEQPEQFDVEHPADSSCNLHSQIYTLNLTDFNPYLEEAGKQQEQFEVEQAAELDPYIEEAEEADEQAQLEPEYLDQAAELDPYIEEAKDADEQAQPEQLEIEQVAEIDPYIEDAEEANAQAQLEQPEYLDQASEFRLHCIPPRLWNDDAMKIEGLSDEEYLDASPCARARRRQDRRNGVAGGSSSLPSPPWVLCLPDYLCGGGSSSSSSPAPASVSNASKYWW
ncbi:hypothetical protein HK102_007884, partial [Quaeritorhiza haematococci]